MKRYFWRFYATVVLRLAFSGETEEWFSEHHAPLLALTRTTLAT